MKAESGFSYKHKDVALCFWYGMNVSSISSSTLRTQNDKDISQELGNLPLLRKEGEREEDTRTTSAEEKGKIDMSIGSARDADLPEDAPHPPPGTAQAKQ